MNISDETLMDFADDALAPADAARVAAAVAEDAMLAEKVARLRDGRAAARGAFAHVLLEPVPQRLLDVLARARELRPDPPIPAAPPRSRRGRVSFPTGRRWPALAAAVLLGVVGGWTLATFDRGPGMARLEPALVAALESDPSGHAAAPAVLATHVSADGQFCRAFAVAEAGARLVGLACREPQAGWRLRALVALRDVAGFAPASDLDPVLSEVLERLGAGPALSGAAEREAIAGGWRQQR